MLQPLHRNNINTPTRCDVMVAEPSRDWSVFKQIFAEHWDAFQHAHPRYQTSYYDSRMAKMLGCGNPEKMGFSGTLPSPEPNDWRGKRAATASSSPIQHAPANRRPHVATVHRANS